MKLFVILNTHKISDSSLTHLLSQHYRTLLYFLCHQLHHQYLGRCNLQVPQCPVTIMSYCGGPYIGFSFRRIWFHSWQPCLTIHFYSKFRLYNIVHTFFSLLTFWSVCTCDTKTVLISLLKDQAVGQKYRTSPLCQRLNFCWRSYKEIQFSESLDKPFLFPTFGM